MSFSCIGASYLNSEWKKKINTKSSATAKLGYEVGKEERKMLFFV